MKSLLLFLFVIVYVTGCTQQEMVANDEAPLTPEEIAEKHDAGYRVWDDFKEFEDRLNVLLEQGKNLDIEDYNKFSAEINDLARNGVDEEFIVTLRNKLFGISLGSPDQGKQVDSTDVYDAPPPEFTNLEGNIEILLNQGHGIGPDVYDDLVKRFNALDTTKIPQEDVDLMKQKLAKLNPGTPVDEDEYTFELFATIEQELDNAISNDNQVGEDHAQRIRNDIATLESRGFEADDIELLRSKLNRAITGDLQKGTEQEAALLEKLPDCGDQIYTVTPVDLNEVYEISPLGGIGPPGHTIPTNHMYLHITGGQSSTKIVDLRAPGYIYITSVSSDEDDLVPGRTEYVIRYAVCKDVYGYFNHVKELSAELTSIIADVECEQWTVNPGNICQKNIFEGVSAGTIIGGVGHLQGNFDFGTYDLRKTNDFANPDRYGIVTPHIQCPLEYYDDSTKAQFYSKIGRTAEPRCGEIMLDIKGTLQGNWYAEGGTSLSSSGWSGQLAFVKDNIDPSKLIISVGGVISEPAKWIFTPKTSGLVNRRFSDVTADGNIYCYDQGQPGRILVEMTSDTSLQIEAQSGSCSSSLVFDSPTIYDR